jgi:hypothetical protein
MADARVICFWFIGALCVFFGALIAGSVDPSALGATTTSVVIAYFIAFVLILLGGMFWISTTLIQVEEL